MTTGTIKIPDAYSFPSNSPEIGVEVERVCKVLEATATHKIVVLKPVIDKLRLTFSGLGVIQHVDGLQAEAYWSGVHQLASYVAQAADEPSITPCSVEGYWTGLRVKLDGGAVATFGFKPRKATNAAVRMEFNPSRLSPAGLKGLFAAWNLIEGKNIPLAAHLASARVSRCDVALDVLNLKLADLFVHCPAVWKVWICSSMTDGVQTINFYKGAMNQSPFLDPKKRANVVVYDKREERLAMGEAPEFGSLAHTRIEFHLNKTSYFKNLANTQYPAKDWVFCRTVLDEPPLKANRWKTFLDSARFRGYAAAEALLDEDEKAALDLAHLNPASQFQDLFDKSVWKHWPDAVGVPALALLIELASVHPSEMIGQSKFAL